MGKKKKKNLYLVGLNASKAFDGQRRPNPMNALRIKQVAKRTLRIVFNNYKKTKVKVRNGEEESDFFITTIGFKQGGPLSPKIYNVRAEELLKRIESIECEIIINGTRTVPAIAYADDNKLLAIREEVMQR